MSSAINPEAAQPSSTLAFEQSDRNPQVTNWNGTDSEGWAATYACGFRRADLNASGPSAVGNAGLVNYEVKIVPTGSRTRRNAKVDAGSDAGLGKADGFFLLEKTTAGDGREKFVLSR